MDIKKQIQNDLKLIVKELGVNIEPKIDLPELEKGDFTSNIAFILAKELKKSPQEIASQISLKLSSKDYSVKPDGGFINFTVKKEILLNSIQKILKGDENTLDSSISNKKYMVEYAHPNTHKEMHIGHMRTLITGEAISRLLEAVGVKVFRANYQGDIGPHVAKAIYGIKKIMAEKNLKLEDVEKWDNIEKAHFLGQGYALGSTDYETNKEEIDKLNTKLYQKSEDVLKIYETTRKWSLDYYDDFYTRFYTHFDRLFFESEMAECGKKIVTENIGKVFIEDAGAVIFPGEKYGLHRRVFITKDGNPTYEGKEMCNAHKQYEAFNFDKKIHVVASEQVGYFKVVFKALELIDPKKFQDKQFHLSMGMVQLISGKMSSRSGDVLTVDWLIGQVKEKVDGLFSEGRLEAEDKTKVAEQITIGAIKYSVLVVGTGQNAVFDINKSVSLQGDSGPYLQYTFARTQSIIQNSKHDVLDIELKDREMEVEESDLIRHLFRYFDVVSQAAESLSPSLLCSYLFNLAQRFNLFYQKHKVIGSSKEEQRLALVAFTGATLKHGLNILGIEAPEKI